MKREGRAAGGRGGSLRQGFSCAHRSAPRSGRAVAAHHEDVPSSGGSLGFCITRVALGERKQHFGSRLGSLFSAQTLSELDLCPLQPASVTAGNASESLRALHQQKSESLEQFEGKMGPVQSLHPNIGVCHQKPPLPLLQRSGVRKTPQWDNSGFPSRGEGL